MSIMTASKKVNQIRVLIVEDSSTMRAMLDLVLGRDQRFLVVAVAGNLASARKQIEVAKPDLITLDLTLPDGSGLTFLEEMKDAARPAVIVISSSTAAGSADTSKALSLGAEACFDKTQVMAFSERFRDAAYKATETRSRNIRQTGHSSEVTPVMTTEASHPPVPADEARRLEILSVHGLDKPGGDARFDLVTEFAADLLDFPIAMTNFIGRDIQFSKSSKGRSAIKVETMPRRDAFCSHAIARDRVMVVPDARLDPRFSSNPLVMGDLAMRFYAGAPIIARDGTRLGALCVIDVKPRELAETKQQQLAKLSHMIAERIEN